MLTGLRNNRVLPLLLVVFALVVPVSQAAMLCCAQAGVATMAHAETAQPPSGTAVGSIDKCHEDAQIPKTSSSGHDAVASGTAMDADCLSDCLEMLQLSVPEQEFAQDLAVHAPSLRPPQVPHILPAHRLPLLRPPAA